MKRNVILLPRAKFHLQEAARWWAEHRSERQADRWLEAVRSLTDEADHMPRAPDADRFEIDLRQKLLGIGKQPTHRLVFYLNERDVVIIAVRHLAQDDLPADTPLD